MTELDKFPESAIRVRMSMRHLDIPLYKGSGVYSLTNENNGKVYVGSALSVQGRIKGHIRQLKRGKHENPYLQRAWDKHGESSFRFDVIESCDPSQCVIREQHWIDQLKSYERDKGYNLSPSASSTLGLKWSDEAKRRHKEARKGLSTAHMLDAAIKATKGKPRPNDVKAKISASNKGKPKSEDHKQKVKANHWSKRHDAQEIIERSAMKHRGKRHSDEHRAKISAANRERWRKYREERNGTTS